MADRVIHELLCLTTASVDQTHRLRIDRGRAIRILATIHEQDGSIGESLRMGLGSIFGAPLITHGSGLESVIQRIDHLEKEGMGYQPEL